MTNLLIPQNLAVWTGHFSGNLPKNNPEGLYGFACIDRKIAGDNG
jgi:hypothetical protein